MPKGKLLIIGGKEDKQGTDSEMEEKNRSFSPNEILKLLAKSVNDRIEIITVASSEPESIRETYETTLSEIGYTNFGFLDICDEHLHTDYHFKRVEAADTVFFTGGDQNRILEILHRSEITGLLKEKYLNQENFTVAGTSAGAMCLPKMVILEAANGEAMLEHDLEMDTGLDFIDSCIVDTHFVHRARFGRLAHAVISHQECWGIGLGEDTALLIEEGCRATCRGSGMVWLISAEHIGQTNIETVKKGFPIYAENIKTHILTDNCTFDFSSRSFKGNDT